MNPTDFASIAGALMIGLMGVGVGAGLVVWRDRRREQRIAARATLIGISVTEVERRRLEQALAEAATAQAVAQHARRSGADPVVQAEADAAAASAMVALIGDTDEPGQVRPS